MQKTHTPLDDCRTAPLPSTDLNLIYTDFMNLLKLSKKHYAKLKPDAWPDKLIKDSFIRSLSLSKIYTEKKILQRPGGTAQNLLAFAEKSPNLDRSSWFLSEARPSIDLYRTIWNDDSYL